ncbi:RNA methyltransferase [Enterovirga rhinocerotis]|uniref:tRNA/rRNA methyltransferase n=1 Tax=Enterovirga rhinocerotis TaxID=1339210 RepID=A0A4R7C8S6_9HYPH|nr:RNA methyltransferase [Enterovirga rhinocerotis]TDR93117.1 tRNA/rRNA methyltransferase [Enterovirga rhinocerotis]
MTEADALRAPAIILVEPQMPQNIGMAARAMANFGLAELRLVAPREGWPHPDASGPAAGADHILEPARAFPTTAAAIGDLHFVLATTARSRGQMKRVLGPEEALAELARRAAAGERTGILFGRERTGLENDDVSLADAILTFPVDPAHASLNLAAAVMLAGYEWTRAVGRGLPFDAQDEARPAAREAVTGLFAAVEEALDEAGFYPPAKKPVMVRNMRDMFHRMQMREQDVRTWRGAVRALVEARARRNAGGHLGRSSDKEEGTS